MASVSRPVLTGVVFLALLIGVPFGINAIDRSLSADAVGGPPGTTYAPGARPNIVFISTDDMTLDEMRYLPQVRSLLGEQGVTFTEFTAPQPLCCPSRAQFLTGQYAQNNGVYTNSGPLGGYQRLVPETAMPVWLQDAGYHTAMVGKYINGYKPPGAGEPPGEVGWDTWDPTVGKVYQYKGYAQYNDGERFKPRAYHSDYVGRRSAELVEELAATESPFFLWTSFVSPHGRVTPGAGPVRSPPGVANRHRSLYPRLSARARSKPSFNERNMTDKPPFLASRRRVDAGQIDALQRARARALTAVDEAVARIVTALRSSGAASNTLVVFTSDNGFLLGEHRHQGKQLLYDESVRVPLLMAGLDLPRGVQNSSTTAMIDLAPSFAELAGATPLVEVDGQTIDATDASGPTELDDRTLLVQAGARNVRADPTGWWFRGVRTSRYTYVRFERDGFVELYDRLRDPFELRNVAANPRYELVRIELAERAVLLSDCIGPTCRVEMGPVPPLPPPVTQRPVTEPRATARRQDTTPRAR